MNKFFLYISITNNSFQLNAEFLEFSVRAASMEGPLCLETLLLTIMLWVAVFGTVDELVQRVNNGDQRLALYAAMGLSGVVLISASDDFSFCSLL